MESGCGQVALAYCAMTTTQTCALAVPVAASFLA